MITSRTASMAGLSPQVRGNPVIAHEGGKEWGSIPAGAGEPLAPSSLAPKGQVYPRRCGGTHFIGPFMSDDWGLSPQVRGNHATDIEEGWSRGSIPAGAGEPPEPDIHPSGVWVYPRRCGGTPMKWAGLLRQWGLSPQVRGNRDDQRPAPSRTGSIPAGAGEPGTSPTVSSGRRVYPRRCGGTSSLQQVDCTRLLRSEGGLRRFTTS